MSIPESSFNTVDGVGWLRSTTGRLVVSAGRVAIATGATSVLLIAVAVISARVVGPTGRGAIVLVTTTATYLMLVTSLGTPISARVMLGTADRRTVLSHYLGLGLAISTVQIIVTAILVQVILTHSGVQLTLGQDMLAGLYGGGLLLAYMLMHGLYGIGLNEHAAVVQVGGATVQLLLVIFLGVAGIVSPWPYVAAMFAGTLGQIAASVAVLAFTGFLAGPKLSVMDWRTMIVRGAPAIGLSLGQAAVLRVDRILIGLFLSASAVGVYSVASTATDVVSLLPAALSQVLFQRIASKTIDPAIANRARAITLGVSLLTAVVLYLVAPVALDRLVGDRFAGALMPLRILLIAAVLLASYQIDAYALAARGQLWFAGSATMVGLGVLIAADLLLIPTNGILGAAWASVIAFGVMAGVVRLIARRVEAAAAD